VFLLKRTIREAALAHDIYATFMAKPMATEPGSAMHIHQSIVDPVSGQSLFSDAETGAATPLFESFIGGQQRYLPAIMSMLAPYVNSYRRIARDSGAPINTQWGHDNRTAGLRVPPSDAANRRLENRIPSSVANPYLAIAAVLATGYLGMVEGLKPSAAVEHDANIGRIALPRSLIDSLALMEDCQPLVEILGQRFVSAYTRVKQAEYETFMQTISPWEREFLLLNV
jgi:glutamine synthetase